MLRKLSGSLIAVIMLMAFCFGCSDTNAPKDEPTDVPPFTLSQSSLSLCEGETCLVTASVRVDRWTSSDTEVAEVSGGVVKAKACGNAKIAAEANGQMATCDVNVTTLPTPTPIDGIDLLGRKGINVYGRVDAETVSGEQGLKFVNSASGFEVSFTGAELVARLSQRCTLTPNKSYLRVFVDGIDSIVTLDKSGIAEYKLASDLDDGFHTVRAYKTVEEEYSEICLFDVFGENIQFYTPRSMPKIKVTVYGDSITAGYGALGKAGGSHTADKEDGTSTYAFRVAEMLNAQLEVLCMQGRSLAVPGWADDVLLKNVYNKYSVKSNKIWDFAASQPSDYIIINLGENDSRGVLVGFNGFRGTNEQFTDGYKEMIAGLRAANPNAKIICCYGMLSGVLIFEEDILDMVSDLNSAGDKNVYAYKMKLCPSAQVGANGHPGAENHRENAQLLYNFLTSLK